MPFHKPHDVIGIPSQKVEQDRKSIAKKYKGYPEEIENSFY